MKLYCLFVLCFCFSVSQASTLDVTHLLGTRNPDGDTHGGNRFGAGPGSFSGNGDGSAQPTGIPKDINVKAANTQSLGATGVSVADSAINTNRVTSTNTTSSTKQLDVAGQKEVASPNGSGGTCDSSTTTQVCLQNDVIQDAASSDGLSTPTESGQAASATT
jgi:hypothetical protein